MHVKLLYCMHVIKVFDPQLQKNMRNVCEVAGIV